MGKQTDVSLPDIRRDEAMARFVILRPHIENDVPLAQAARAARILVRTARRWLARHRHDGLSGLMRVERADQGRKPLGSHS